MPEVSGLGRLATADSSFRSCSFRWNTRPRRNRAERGTTVIAHHGPALLCIPAKTSTQLKWDYRPQSKCKFHRKKRLRWAAFSWRVHNLTMLRNGGTTRICDENPNTFGVIFFNITRNIPINMGQWTCQSILNRHIGVNPSKMSLSSRNPIYI